MEITPFSVAIPVIFLALATWALKLVNWVWLRPKKLEKSLRDHGLAGNPYRLLIGDLGEYSAFANHTKSKTISLSDDIAPHVLPYVHHVIQKYDIAAQKKRGLWVHGQLAVKAAGQEGAVAGGVAVVREFYEWQGKNSFMWFGPNPRVNIVEPDLMKEIMSKPNLFRKPPDPLGEIITEHVAGNILEL
ncbi:hypothetical protein RJ640_020509 [Escallonia rubra]|uniref:Cytochrome P450 n=1 Tax=Escallonia rubra TaxID=112253 RepID=A0AA88R5A0_9ASTE|nr:hypothetical protein RJ640_020509 [Escallonia rubra]